jgi:hypothetical protein
MIGLLVLAWKKLHALRIPHSWGWTLVYAAVVTVVCKVVHHVTHHYIDMHSIHIEVLLPAFVVGCIVDTPCAREELKMQRQRSTIRRMATLNSLDANGSPSLAGATNGEKSATLNGEKSGALNGDRVGAPLGDRAFIRVEHHVKSQSIAEEGAGLPKYADDNLRAAGSASNADGSVSVCVVAEAGPPGLVQDDDGMVTCIIKTVSKSDSHDTEVTTTIAVQASQDDSRKGSTKEQQSTSHTTTLFVKPPRDSPPLRPVVESDAGKKPTEQRLQLLVEPDAEPAIEISNISEEGNGRRADSKASAASQSSQLSRHGLETHEADCEHIVQTSVSMVFMVLVGLSMPPLVGENAGDANSNLDAGTTALHVLMVSVLMIAGKMFPAGCYRTEAPLKARFALCLGMCPRGEVGASIIVISLELGASGPAIIISMSALVINLVMSGGFIAMVKMILNSMSPSAIAVPSIADTPNQPPSVPLDLKVAKEVEEIKVEDIF